jgi:UDP-glucose 4-epimerase
VVTLKPTINTGRTFDRDVVLRKGIWTLLHEDLTPQQSLEQDILAVRQVLIAAEIEHLLIRGERNRPVVAVDRRDRKTLAAAFAEAFAREPFYAKPVDVVGGAVLLADGLLAADSKTSVLRLYRPRIDPAGQLRYGARHGVQIELWKFDGEQIVAPQENALMRRILPREEAIDAHVTRFGVEWPTFEGMWSPHVSDVTFDIDLVFSWVDGTDLEFQRQRAARMKSYVVGEGDDSEARFRQINELRYALRSVYMFAPWVRNIYIVTDSPRPKWLDEHPRVQIVPSEMFFKDPSVLPTHNSQAVESQLQHIPGLSEHFLYSNDDMFFGRPVSPEMFFSPGGVTRFVEATTRIGLGESNQSRSGFENAARVNRRLLEKHFGAVTTRHLEHCAAPLRKSVLLEMEEIFAEDFQRTAASRFRAATDISVTNSFYHYYALMTGRAVTQENAKVKYIETTLKSSLRELRRLLKTRSMDMFCLNDGSFPEISVEERTAAVTDFLTRYFPIPAPWEKRDAPAHQALDAS